MIIGKIFPNDSCMDVVFDKVSSTMCFELIVVLRSFHIVSHNITNINYETCG